MHQRTIDDGGRHAVHNAGEQVADIVHRDERLVAHVEDAFERTRGRGFLERRVHRFDGGGTFDFRSEIDDRHVRGRHAQRDAVDLALHLGDDKPGRFGGTGRRRNDAERRGPGAAHVLVGEIEDLLVVGVAVHRRHEPVLESEIVHDDFDDRHEAVGGTRRAPSRGAFRAL